MAIPLATDPSLRPCVSSSINNILTGDIPTELTQRDLREQWEREFDRKFIQPILSSLHTDVQRQMEQVLSEKRIANNPMLR